MNARRFGESIKSARLARGWTKSDLQRESGVRLFSIYCIEEEFNADRYQADTCRKLVEALGLSAKTHDVWLGSER